MHMTTLRQTVSIRRQATLFAVLGTSFLLTTFTLLDLRLTPSTQTYDLLLQRPLSDLPGWIGHGWWPLDFALIAVLLWVLYYGLVNSPNFKNPTTVPGNIKMFLGMIFGGIGGILGIFFCLMGGWYIGLQGFVMGGTATIVGIAVVGALMSIMHVIGQFIKLTYELYVEPAIAPVTILLKKYFNAEDVPTDSKE